MPEITGTVTAKSEKGIMLRELGERWANFSNVEYRGEPFVTDVKKGDTVHIVYNEKEWEDGGKSLFISVIDRVVTSRDVTPPDDVDAGLPDHDPFEGIEHAPQTQPAAREWGYREKDLLIAKVSAVKVAGELYAACITAGLYKKLPMPDEISAYADAIEAKLD